MKASNRLISDLARAALNGDHTSFHSLMQILEEIDHPILEDIGRGFSGPAVVSNMLVPLSMLVEGLPKPIVHTQSLVWNGSGNHRDNGNFPAEIWFEDQYVAYFKNGKRHRDGNKPAVVDVTNGTVAYYENGDPRRHSKGPFKVERSDGHVMLTYVMDERMATRNGHTSIRSHDSGRYDVEDDAFEEPVEGGDQVIITRDYIDIEGIGKSTPSDEDLKNLGIWRKEMVNWLEWGSDYIRDYLDKFK